MASPVYAPKSCAIEVNAFDGARQPLATAVEVLVTILDGHQNRVYRDFARGPSLTVRGLPFADNFADNYTVAAWASGHRQAGFTPVKAAPGPPVVVDIMLLPAEADFNFSRARWVALKETSPRFAELLAAGAGSEDAAAARYTDLMERRPAALACLFNLLTAMAQVHLPAGTPLDYFRELIWDDTMQPDRFFAWAARPLVDQVRRAAAARLFAPEPGTALFHAGATSSFKQLQFGEANLQLTFHENDQKTIDGVECLKVEPDIDYYKDPAAHALLEVLANKVSGSLTDPRQVYVLRWIAGRQAGVPGFEPPYVLV